MDKIYRSTTEHAADIRAILKREHGWSARQVSIRAEYFSTGSAIRVEIKDPGVSLAVVKQVATRAEDISRDALTGEILSGGNRYVTVNYSTEAQEVIGRRYADAVQRAVDAVVPGSSGLEQVEGTEIWVGRPDASRIALWRSSGYLRDCYTIESAAYTVGRLCTEEEEDKECPCSHHEVTEHSPNCPNVGA